MSIWIVFGCLGRSQVKSCGFEGGNCEFDGCFWSEVDCLVVGSVWVFGLGLVAIVVVFSRDIGGGGDICGGEDLCDGSGKCGHPRCPP